MANQASTAPVSSQRPSGRRAGPPVPGQAAGHPGSTRPASDQSPWPSSALRWSAFRPIRIPSEQASSTTETTIAPWRLPLSISPKMYIGAGLGQQRLVAGDHDHAAELAQGPAERERRAGQDRRPEGRQRDPAEGRQGPGARASRRPPPRPGPSPAAPAARSGSRTGRSRTAAPARSPASGR